MRKISWALIGLVLVGLLSAARGQEVMTAARFREIAATPGDKVPLLPKLAAIPLWTNAEATVVMNYATGKVVQEELSPQARTVGGKYVVYSFESKFYHKPVNCILTYDETASALKNFGLYADGQADDVVVEGTWVYDYDRKVYAGTSTYGNGFQEITVGSYSATESSDKVMVYRNGVLFMTRYVKTHPVLPAK